MSQFDDRFDALANNAPRYKMKKPCRRGHMGERYSSTGLCVACVMMNDKAKKENMRKARIIGNFERFEPLQVFKAVIRPSVHHYLDDATEIFQFGSNEQKMMLVEAITAVRQGVKVGGAITSQGELNYDTLRAVVDLSPTRICYVDGATLDEQQHPEMGLLIRIGEHWYIGSTLKAVWDQVRDVARPVTLG